MFVLQNERGRYPLKAWLNSEKDLEATCLEQAQHLMQLPFLHKWVCLMPDTHAGMGMPIGGVIAAKDVIIPNAVGVDIGCGMAYVGTNIPVKVLKETMTGNGNLLQGMVGDILRNIPVGFVHHKTPMPCYTMDLALEELSRYEKVKKVMNDLGVTGMTVTQVMGCGIQKGAGEMYRGVEMDATLLPKVKIEVVVSKIPVDSVIEAAKKALYTGHIGDGKIFVYNVDKVVKIRTGEEDFAALQDVE